MDKCPYCNSKEGYYTKIQVKGSMIYRYNYDGSEADNGDMYDGLTYTSGKCAYCLSCDKRLFKMSDREI